MKYIYKHGNQYWYQRAIPIKFKNILGKSTLKISLKTNKISVAIKRAKLQALEHKKMFHEIEKDSRKYFKKIFGGKKIKINKYILDFIDDYDDLINKVLFNKNELINLYNKESTKNSTQPLENIILNEDKLYPPLSKTYYEYLRLKNIYEDSKKSKSIRKSIGLMIKLCGDKSLIEYSSIDAKIFRDYFINLDKVATGKRNQSYIQSLFTVILNHYSIDKKNPFSCLKWPENTKILNRQIFSNEELMKIKDFCIQSDSFISLLCGLIYNTGCSFSEVIGLKNEDISLGKYNPYLVIRSNEIRNINNIYKRRVIPLVGLSLKSMKKINILESNSFLFESHLKLIKKSSMIEVKLNDKIKEISEGKTLISFKYTLIERLKKIGCPEQIISEVIGLSKKESFYGNAITLDIKSSWLSQI